MGVCKTVSQPQRYGFTILCLNIEISIGLIFYLWILANSQQKLAKYAKVITGITHTNINYILEIKQIRANFLSLFKTDKIHVDWYQFPVNLFRLQDWEMSFLIDISTAQNNGKEVVE